MKIIMTLFIILGVSVLSAPTSTAQGSLETELLNVMQAKSQAYFAADTTAFQTFWIKDAHSSRSVIDKSDYSRQVGWQDLIAKLKKDSEETGQIAVAVSFDSVHIRTSGNMAFVEADERYRWPKNDSIVANVHVYTVMVQENGTWKTANQIRVGTDTYAVNAPNREYELNTIGYDLLKEKRVSEAIDLFAVIVKLNPTSWNAYDSLGEGYALAGDKKSAIKNYKKSLNLNPENEAGKKALTILEKQ